MNDNCLRCPQEDVAPITELHAGAQVSHLYRCDRCGYVWSTNRDLRFYGEEAA